LVDPRCDKVPGKRDEEFLEEINVPTKYLESFTDAEEAKKFVDVFYERYPSVAEWHQEFAKIVEANEVSEIVKAQF
jgi:DNA polymerase I-like protein with 3'-5' exonuclease and polymerase domains